MLCCQVYYTLPNCFQRLNQITLHERAVLECSYSSFLHNTCYPQIFIFAGLIDVKWHLIVVLVCCYHIILILKIETLMYNKI